MATVGPILYKTGDVDAPPNEIYNSTFEYVLKILMYIFEGKKLISTMSSSLVDGEWEYTTDGKPRMGWIVKWAEDAGVNGRTYAKIVLQAPGDPAKSRDSYYVCFERNYSTGNSGYGWEVWTQRVMSDIDTGSFAGARGRYTQFSGSSYASAYHGVWWRCVVHPEYFYLIQRISGYTPSLCFVGYLDTEGSQRADYDGIITAFDARTSNRGSMHSNNAQRGVSYDVESYGDKNVVGDFAVSGTTPIHYRKIQRGQMFPSSSEYIYHYKPKLFIGSTWVGNYPDYLQCLNIPKGGNGLEFSDGNLNTLNNEQYFYSSSTYCRAWASSGASSSCSLIKAGTYYG